MYNRSYYKANTVRQKLLLFIDNEILSNKKYSKPISEAESLKICFDEKFSHESLYNYQICNYNSLIPTKTKILIKTIYNFSPSLIKNTRNQYKTNTYDKKIINNVITNVNKNYKTKTFNQNIVIEENTEMDNNKYVIKLKLKNSKTILVKQKKNKDYIFLLELCDKYKKLKENRKTKKNKKRTSINRNRSNFASTKKKIKKIETKMNFENLRKSHKKTSIDNNYNCFKLKNEKLLIKSNWLVI